MSSASASSSSSAGSPIVVFGLLFAYLHAVPLHQKADETYPVVDATVFGAIACILIAYLLPRIKNLKAFGAEVELEEVVEDLTDNVQKTSDLLEKVSSRLAITLARIGEQSTNVEKYAALRAFVQDRMADAKLYISESANIDLRLSVWLSYDDEQLTFFISNDTDAETTGKIVAENEGIIGRALAENETWNVADAINSPAYVAVRRTSTARYGAILVAPISFPGHRFGVLSAD